MMLRIEGELASPVGRFERAWYRGHGLAPEMHDLGVGREEHPSSASPDRRAEVDVLRVHEVPLVEQSGRLRVCSPYEQARAADPVDLARTASQAGDIRAEERHAAIVPGDEQLLPELRQRADHRAERQLRAAAHVNQAAIPPSDITVVTVDTAFAPIGIGAYGSRNMVNAGNAVHLAAGEVREKAIRVAAHVLGIDEKDIEIGDGVARVKDEPAKSVTFKDIAKALGAAKGLSIPKDISIGNSHPAPGFWPTTAVPSRAPLRSRT